MAAVGVSVPLSGVLFLNRSVLFLSLSGGGDVSVPLSGVLFLNMTDDMYQELLAERFRPLIGGIISKLSSLSLILSVILFPSPYRGYYF